MTRPKRAFAPKGLYDSAWGFNPGFQPQEPFTPAIRPEGAQRTPSIRFDFAQLNRDDIRSSMECARTPSNYGPYKCCVIRSISRPFRARRGLGRFPGLNPRAESYSPFGGKALRARLRLVCPDGTRLLTFRNSIELVARKAIICINYRLGASSGASRGRSREPADLIFHDVTVRVPKQSLREPATDVFPDRS
jgi:hypothetical protein